MKKFVSKPDDQLQYMYRFQTTLPDGVKESDIKGIEEKIVKLKGYREGDRKDKPPLINSVFGNKSIYGAKSVSGMKYFMGERILQGQGDGDNIKGYQIKLDISNAQQVDVHKHLKELKSRLDKKEDTKDFDVFVKPTIDARIKNGDRIKDLQPNQQKKYAKNTLVNYHLGMNKNQEMVVESPVRIVEIKPVSYKLKEGEAPQRVIDMMNLQERDQAAFREAKKTDK